MSACSGTSRTASGRGSHRASRWRTSAFPGSCTSRTLGGPKLVHLGDGDVPLDETIAALRDVGYDGALTLEWEKLWHPELDEPDVALPRAIAYFARPLAVAEA